MLWLQKTPFVSDPNLATYNWRKKSLRYLNEINCDCCRTADREHVFHFRGEMAAGLTRTVLQIRLEQKLNSQSDLTGRFSQEIKRITRSKS